MTSSGHAFGHVSNTEKLQRLPGFALFLKGLILRGFQNVKKFVISDQSMILKKECIAMFSIETCQKRLDLMKTAFPCLKKPKCPRYILEVTLSALVQFTLPADLGKIKQSHAELVFLRFNFFCSFFCFSLISSLLVHFFIFHLVKHKEKNI